MATLQAAPRHAGTAQWSADGRRCGLLRDIHRARSSSQHRCHGSQQSAHDRTASRLLTHTPAQSIERRTPHAHSFGHAPPSSDATRAIPALHHCYATNLSYPVLLCQSQNAELGFPRTRHWLLALRLIALRSSWSGVCPTNHPAPPGQRRRSPHVVAARVASRRWIPGNRPRR